MSVFFPPIYVYIIWINRTFININVIPLPLLFKALLQGQKDHMIFSRHLIYILQERFRAFRPAWVI
jgi:hypothetical protein